MTTDAHDTALARLSDYLRGDGSDSPAVDTFEDDLFARALAGDAPELSFLDDLATTVRQLVARGTFELYLTAAEVERLRASDMDVQYLELSPSPHQALHVQVSRTADIMVTRVSLDLRGIESLDVELELEGGTAKTLHDVRFDPADGAVFFCCEGDLARRTVGVRAISRYYAREATQRRLLAELTTTSELAG